MGNPVVAVRSSASGEDGTAASAAGQHDSFLGVRGIDAVADAVHACRASLWSARARSYRKGDEEPSMAVIVQLQVEADVAGVMFTPTDPGLPTLIESSWGLGPTVVEGRLTPDRYEVRDGVVTSTIADKPTSLTGDGLTPVLDGKRRTPTLTDATAVQLAALGNQAAAVFGAPQDLEWAVAADKIWLLQSRPITADPPTPTASPQAALTSTPASFTGSPASFTGSPASFSGTPASRGLATGPARIVRGPSDFPKVHPGDILVCPYTDPSWTPLLTIAAGVITESGGILSHAAIVAREQSIPAVVAVPQATTRIPDGTPLTVNGTTGTIHL
ncbi:MAG TPA: PEP/pyruvate-binding domain-containing protein [Kribbella sp.]|nr:PEP/pyruvate-binding domain-containing protein [Kribbella sp.]